MKLTGISEKTLSMNTVVFYALRWWWLLFLLLILIELLTITV